MAAPWQWKGFAQARDGRGGAEGAVRTFPNLFPQVVSLSSFNFPATQPAHSHLHLHLHAIIHHSASGGISTSICMPSFTRGAEGAVRRHSVSGGRRG
jgi:hypothetical protein